jgi:hypothetical protein
MCLSLLCTDYFSNQLGGMNSLLQIETSPAIPLVSKVPTIILGMDVSHGSPGQSDVPSIAAVSYLNSSFSVVWLMSEIID